MSIQDNDEKRVIHSRSDSIEIMLNDKADEVIEEPFHSVLSRYQIELEMSMKGIDFTFDCVHLLHYKCHKINFKHGGSYIESLHWIKNKNSNSKPYQ